MPSSDSGGYSFTVALEDEQATLRLMADIAGLIEPGDLITLSGDLGAGKTTFARAFIRHVAADEGIEVPSPSFTLMQSYDLPRFPVVHVDLYRLSGPGDMGELGFDDVPENAVTLLEWPDRAGDALPMDRLDVSFTLSPADGLSFRHAEITGYGSFAARAERIEVIRAFLNDAGMGQAARLRIQGDASTRSYERLMLDGTSYILMNSPKRPDGPPVRDGKPYSQIAHLAESVTPFIAMAKGLRTLGLSAPAIYAADREAGLLVLEDLGNELVVEGDPPAPIEERYEIAADLLAALHRERTHDTISIEPGVQYHVPRYDVDAMLIETELLLDWFLPLLGSTPDETVRDDFIALWRIALQPALDTPPTWVLRDFHSPNLIWLPERDGINRIGLLDFQDAMMGPAAYDVASLLQDARITVPELMEISLLSRYTRARMAAEPGFDAPRFALLYATMAAQRASKILGIFARLDRRDGKPQYLRHLPRVWSYLQRSLAHPALADLSAWYRANIPAPKVTSS